MPVREPRRVTAEQQQRLSIDSDQLWHFQVPETLLGRTEWRPRLPVIEIARNGVPDDAAALVVPMVSTRGDQHVPPVPRGVAKDPRVSPSFFEPARGPQGLVPSGVGPKDWPWCLCP